MAGGQGGSRGIHEFAGDGEISSDASIILRYFWHLSRSFWFDLETPSAQALPGRNPWAEGRSPHTVQPGVIEKDFIKTIGEGTQIHSEKLPPMILIGAFS
jgi:hypothetical protein